MIVLGDKIYAYSFLLNNFTLQTIKRLRIVDYDDNERAYKKTIKYMENKCIVDHTLLNVLNKEQLYVRRVADYILMKLPYGTNLIELKGVDIAKYEKIDPADVSKGILRLVELGIIEQVVELPHMKDKGIKKNWYTINHNFIFRGNVKDLLTQFMKQETKLKNKVNG